MTEPFIKLYEQTYDAGSDSENTVMRAYCASDDFSRAKKVFQAHDIKTYGEFAHASEVGVFRIFPDSWEQAKSLQEAEVIDEKSLAQLLQSPTTESISVTDVKTLDTSEIEKRRG